MFKPAVSRQAWLKLFLYGRAGAGKTFTSLLCAEGLIKHCGGEIAFLNTEPGGPDFYAKDVPERRIHSAGFKFDIMTTRSIVDAITAVEKLDSKYKVLIVDSLTDFWDAAINAYTGRRTKLDGIPLHAWDAIKRPYRRLIAAIMNGPFNAIVCARERTEYELGPEGALVVSGTGPRCEKETPHEFNCLIRLVNDDNVIKAEVIKDRSGVLFGKTIEYPDYEKLCGPLVKLLDNNCEQVRRPDEDSTAAYDVEKLTDEEIRRQNLAEWVAKQGRDRIQTARNMKELEAAGRQIHYYKAILPAATITELRQLYNSKYAEFTKADNNNYTPVS